MCGTFLHDGFWRALETRCGWNRRMNRNCVPNASNWHHMPPSSFWHALQDCRVGVKNFLHNGLDGINSHYADEIEVRIKTVCQTPRTDSTSTLAHFGMHFESIWVDVKISSTTGFDGYKNLDADNIKARNETKCRTPRMGYICALAHFGVHFESGHWYETFLRNVFKRVL